ncbi:deoxynucleoside kinase [Candidatus Woesearchaeota archaeon]|nr:deoxynucleoside kinase [Candidatus Woesearchaeota archaeon]
MVIAAINDDKLIEVVSAVQQEICSISSEEALRQVWNEKEELEELLRKHRPTLMVGGNIGFGKTTVASIIGTYGKIKEIREPVETNPLLDLYYSNMWEYNERMQLDAMNTRLYDIILTQQKYPNQPLIFDRTHYEDLYIFCETLTAAGIMKESQKKFCDWYFKMKLNQLECRHKVRLAPDMIIFLQGDIETGWKRIHSRDRPMEVRKDAGKGVGLTPEFYASLHSQYETFPKRVREIYKGHILTLPQDTVEVADATNSKGQLYVVKSVKEALKVVYE